MLPDDRAQSAVAAKPSWTGRFTRWVARAPFYVKVFALACAVVLSPFICLYAMWVAVIAVAQRRPSRGAAYAVAAWVFPIALFSQYHRPWAAPLLVLPFAVAWVAGTGSLARWYAPCRTTAWAMLWSIPAGFILLRTVRTRPEVGVIAAVLLAAAVLSWRMGKGVREGAMGVPGSQGQGPRPAADPGGQHLGPRPAVNPPQPGVPRQPGYGARAHAAAQPYAEHAAQGPRQRHQAGPERPAISIDDAMNDLNAMIGLSTVKEQVRSIKHSIEAARRRAEANISNERPMRHFVFLGPPGTGKTTVARVLAKIFYAFGLLDVPEVVEAQRADLVGEYLGATAIKTNELVDRALGRVLFIDEAYSLVNEGDGQADRFGAEAVQALLKRAEDDRDNLIIILAGYEKQMESFLGSNPGLASRFATRLRFPSYTPAEMLKLARTILGRRGEDLDRDAEPTLWRKLEEIDRRRITDELGNGRFVRTLMEKAGQARDVRVMRQSSNPPPLELRTVRADDMNEAYAELTSRLRGYEDTPTVEGALAELHQLPGLEPVKQQVEAITAQLRMGRLRAQSGLPSAPPAMHFVFTGPPGTGKTTVARILSRIFAALGLLVRPEVVEGHRADLVGEHLGSTALKTNRLIDSAMGGVLFIDEAYSLNNEGYSGGDAFGAEAVQTLLKRAEDDRDRLVIVLAGYSADMDRFLHSNPGLSSRFSTRIAFPSYSPAVLVHISKWLAEQAGDVFDPDAVTALEGIFTGVCDAGRIDELGNGRYARSLFERACAARDLRLDREVRRPGGQRPGGFDLVTLTAEDVQVANQELAG